MKKTPLTPITADKNFQNKNHFMPFHCTGVDWRGGGGDAKLLSLTAFRTFMILDIDSNKRLLGPNKQYCIDRKRKQKKDNVFFKVKTVQFLYNELWIYLIFIHETWSMTGFCLLNSMRKKKMEQMPDANWFCLNEIFLTGVEINQFW